jgi:hypothetical protein
MVGPIDIAGMLSHTDYAMFMGSPGNICPMSWKRCLQHRLPLSLTSKQRWFKYNVNKNNEQLHIHLQQKLPTMSTKIINNYIKIAICLKQQIHG